MDLTDYGNNTLTLDKNAVLDINSSHQLFVRGNATDTVNLGAGWTSAGTISGAAAGNRLASDNSVTFQHFTATSGLATINLFVEQGVQANMAP